MMLVERRPSRGLRWPAVGVAAALGMALGMALGAAGAGAQPIPVRGRVMAPGDLPVPGARVELLAMRSRRQRGLDDLEGVSGPAPVAAAESDREGRFRLLAPGAGIWAVRVLAPGRVPMRRDLQPLLEEMELAPVVLHADDGVRVTVRDPGGRPLPGAQVGARPLAESEFWSQAWQAGSWRPAPRFARTDPEGRARLPRAAGEEVGLEAFASGWLPSPEVRSAGQEVELRLGVGVARRLELQDPQGRPVPGVGVRVGEWLWASGETDAEGSVSLAIPPGSELPVSLDLPRGWFYELTLRDGAAEEEPARARVRLPTPRVVVGRVVDSETHQAIGGALVWLGGDGREAVSADAAGGFRLLTAPAGRQPVRLEVAAAGYLPGRWSWEPEVDDGREVIPELQPALSVSGWVVDAQGAALPGAEVKLRPATPGWRSWRGRGVRSETAASDGSFHFRGLRVGAYLVRASAEGFAPTTLTVDREAMRGGVEVVLGRGAGAHGRVLDPELQPVPGARLRLFERPEAPQVRISRRGEEADFEAVAGPEGGFELRHLPAGPFDLEVSKAGYAAAHLLGVTLPEAGGDLDLGEVVLRRGVAMEGRVVDSRGRPLEGARVEAQSRGQVGLFHRLPARRAQVEGPVSTDAEGRFRLQDLGAGDHFELKVAKDGYQEAVVEAVEAPTGEPVQIVLRPGGRIFGVVVDPEGESVAGVWVLAEISVEQRSPDGTVAQSGWRSFSERTDAEGRFRFEGLPPAKVALSIRARGLAPARVEGLEVAEGEELGPLRLTLEPGAIVEGRVLDPYGRPAPGILVRLQQEGQPRIGFTSGERTDAEGRFMFQGVTPGPASLSVEDSEAGAVREGLEIRPGSQWVDLVLELGRSITGRVVDASGAPVGGAEVYLEGRGEHGSRSMVRPVGSDGRFRFPDLEPGTYHLRARKTGYAEARLEEPLVVGDRPLEGVEVRLLSGASIVGQIEGLEPEDLARVIVQAAPEGGGGVIETPVDYRGRYRIEGVAVGSWRVSATGSDGRIARGQVEVEPGQERVVLNLEFRDGMTLSGVLLHNGRPVPGLMIRLAAGDSPTTGAVITNQEGQFRLGGLDPGDYTLFANDPRTGLRFQRNLELSTDRELVLDILTTRVSGRVLTGGFAPATGAYVRLQPVETGGAAGTPHRAITDAEGRFLLPLVPQGRFQLSILADGREGFAAEIQVAGSEVALGDLVLKGGGP